MSSRQSRTVVLRPDMEELLHEKVASGEYASEDDVINEGLMALAERDASLEVWLRDDVVPTLDLLDVDASRVMTLEEARQRLHARIDILVEKSTER